MMMKEDADDEEIIHYFVIIMYLSFVTFEGVNTFVPR